VIGRVEDFYVRALRDDFLCLCRNESELFGERFLAWMLC